MQERITKDLIEKGIRRRIITFDEEDGLLIARLGENWFYCCSEDGKREADFTEAELTHMVWESVNSEPINDPDEELATECLYYKAVLDEELSKPIKLWQFLEDIPMDPETETIEEPFVIFPAGTHREEIWHWFEETFHLSVTELMNQD